MNIFFPRLTMESIKNLCYIADYRSTVAPSSGVLSCKQRLLISKKTKRGENANEQNNF